MEQIDVPCASCLPPVAGAKRVALLLLCLLAVPGRVRGSPLLSFPICLDFSAHEQKDLDSRLAQHGSDLSGRCQMLPEYKEIMKVTQNV